MTERGFISVHRVLSSVKRLFAAFNRSLPDVVGTGRTQCDGPDVLHQLCFSVILATACSDWPQLEAETGTTKVVLAKAKPSLAAMILAF
ncbi:MAG: hypothetical protein ACP5FY_04855 [Kosmotogaceae bacterium]